MVESGEKKEFLMILKIIDVFNQFRHYSVSRFSILIIIVARWLFCWCEWIDEHQGLGKGKVRRANYTIIQKQFEWFHNFQVDIEIDKDSDDDLMIDQEGNIQIFSQFIL